MNFIVSNFSSLDDNLITVSGSGAGVCLNKYNGSHCLRALQSLTDCESPESNNVFVSNAIKDQFETEHEIGNIISVIDEYIKPSNECRNALISFLCYYKFGLCGEHNVDCRPKAANCVDIRDSVCKFDWEKGKTLLPLGKSPLPDCSQLIADGKFKVCGIILHFVYLSLE